MEVIPLPATGQTELPVAHAASAAVDVTPPVEALPMQAEVVVG